MTQGILLAGGYSSRVGQNKMLLPYRDLPLILHSIRTMAPNVSRIFVITGHYHEEIAKVLQDEPKVEIVLNQEYARGMFSSVLAGARVATEDVFLVPGDYPLIKPQTYQSILMASGSVRVPIHESKKGHPLFLNRDIVLALRMEPLESNLKVFRDRYPLTLVDVADPGILIDIDTLADLAALPKAEKR